MRGCDRWSVKDLREALRSRIRQSFGRMDKLCYVKKLVVLDPGWRFRFLNLRPEFQDLVYSYLLQLRSSERFPNVLVYFPSIVAVCKHTHAEAQRLVYKVNTQETTYR